MLPFDPPFTLGHENAGWVEQLGAGVRGLDVGQPVVVYGPWGCGRVPRVPAAVRRTTASGPTVVGPGVGGLGRDGGLAPLMVVPSARHLVPLDDLEPWQAAPLADAALTPYRVIRKWIAPARARIERRRARRRRRPRPPRRAAARGDDRRPHRRRRRPPTRRRAGGRARRQRVAPGRRFDGGRDPRRDRRPRRRARPRLRRQRRHPGARRRRGPAARSRRHRRRRRRLDDVRLLRPALRGVGEHDLLGLDPRARSRSSPSPRPAGSSSRVQTFPFSRALDALDALHAGTVEGRAVVVPD